MYGGEQDVDVQIVRHSTSSTCLLPPPRLLLWLFAADLNILFGISFSSLPANRVVKGSTPRHNCRVSPLFLVRRETSRMHASLPRVITHYFHQRAFSCIYHEVYQTVIFRVTNSTRIVLDFSPCRRTFSHRCTAFPEFQNKAYLLQDYFCHQADAQIINDNNHVQTVAVIEVAAKSVSLVRFALELEVPA